MIIHLLYTTKIKSKIPIEAGHHNPQKQKNNMKMESSNQDRDNIINSLNNKSIWHE